VAGERAAVDAPTFAGRFVFTVEGPAGGGGEPDVVGAFMEISGLKAEVAVEDVPEGGMNGFVHRLPGRVSWPNVVLRRGVTESRTLFTWLATAVNNGTPGSVGGSGNGAVQRRQATITLLDAAGRQVQSWSLSGAFPVRWSGPTLAVTASDVATEELEIAHHGILPE
jgi:phage tail-like protein